MEKAPTDRAMLLSATHKISTRFTDDIGNLHSGSGTGFWIITKRDFPYFVTNRHNVDPAMHERFSPATRLDSVTIAMRAYSQAEQSPCGDTHAFEIPIQELTIYFPSSRADVAILKPSSLVRPMDPGMIMPGLPEAFMTYGRKPEILDKLFFLGFPGKNRSKAAYDLPIARSCTIASFPEIDYSEEDVSIKTSDTCLVEGLSFAGSSGSPVFREEDGRIELLGIMSGHMAGDQWGAGHPGLSYLTKSTAIQQIISENQL